MCVVLPSAQMSEAAWNKWAYFCVFQETAAGPLSATPHTHALHLWHREDNVKAQVSCCCIIGTLHVGHVQAKAEFYTTAGKKMFVATGSYYGWCSWLQRQSGLQSSWRLRYWPSNWCKMHKHRWDTLLVSAFVALILLGGKGIHYTHATSAIPRICGWVLLQARKVKPNSTLLLPSAVMIYVIAFAVQQWTLLTVSLTSMVCLMWHVCMQLTVCSRIDACKGRALWWRKMQDAWTHVRSFYAVLECCQSFDGAQHFVVQHAVLELFS